MSPRRKERGSGRRGERERSGLCIRIIFSDGVFRHKLKRRHGTCWGESRLCSYARYAWATEGTTKARRTRNEAD